MFSACFFVPLPPARRLLGFPQDAVSGTSALARCHWQHMAIRRNLPPLAIALLFSSPPPSPRLRYKTSDGCRYRP